MASEVLIDEDLARDPNFIAYQEAVKKEQFKDLEPGTYVVFHEGKLVGSGMDGEQLFQELHEKGIQGFFFHQVNVPERVVRLPSPRIVRRG